MNGFIYSHRGMVRKVNEDSGCFLLNAQNDLLMIVADGMGGHNGGEYASQITIDYITKKFLSLEYNMTTRDYIFWIDNLLNEVNSILKTVGSKNKWLEDMGTTIVLAIILKEKTIICNVGDSRCYKVQNQILSQISEDHTFVNLMYKQGIYSLDEMENHPRKHVLTQALGNETKVDPNYKIINNNDYDNLLLATDGLVDLVINEEIEAILTYSNANYRQKAKALIQRALDKGGKDNVTVGIIYKEEKK